MPKCPDPKIIKRVEEMEGCPIESVLRRLYLDEALSKRQISLRWGTSIGFITTCVKYLGLPTFDQEGMNPALRRAIFRICQIEGIDESGFREVLEKRYYTDRLGYRKLMELWGCSPVTIPKLLAFYGLSPKTRSEAVRDQWVDNDSRRKEMSKVFKETAGKHVAIHGHPRQGKTKENCPIVQRVADKLKTNSSLFRPDVREKGDAARRVLFRTNPERHVNAKVLPTQSEELFKAHLESMGLTVYFNHNVNGRWIDLFIPEINTGLECYGHNTLCRNIIRHMSICQTGIKLIYVSNGLIEREDFTGLDQHIRSLQVASSNPATSSENTVIWCGFYSKPFFGVDFHDITYVKTRVGSSYRIDVTIPTHYRITNA